MGGGRAGDGGDGASGGGVYIGGEPGCGVDAADEGGGGGESGVNARISDTLTPYRRPALQQSQLVWVKQIS